MFRIKLENFAYLVEWSIELLLSLPLRGLLNTVILHCCVSMEAQFKWERNGQILWLSRMNFVKRKATKAARKVPTDFPEIKFSFLKRIVDCVQVRKIPPELIINWDQTGAKYVSTSAWTLAEEGSRQIDVIGKEDKREMTVLLSCAMSDFLLPPHLIYCGKTNKCHPDITFPPGWDVHHSENHWSTEATMLHFIDCVLVPYVQSTKQTLGLDKDHFSLALFDVFAATLTGQLIFRP
jgi:hypothetical protein